jgi:isoleucyl-tRNA synthetase
MGRPPPTTAIPFSCPKTDFPMRAGLPQREPEWLARWARIGIYDRLREKAAGQKGARAPFILHDGPPYANGHLHIGHALNKILKDIMVRSQQMMGRDARYVPGWDCHGLPIEWKIEEQYRQGAGQGRRRYRRAFRQECRKFAEGWIDVQREEFKRLGVTGKWDDPYLTMDYHAEAVIAGRVHEVPDERLSLYQGSKPVMWSPVEKTALGRGRGRISRPYQPSRSGCGSQADKAFIAHETTPQNLDALDGASVVIWTTTPWTIPQNRAVALIRHRLRPL